MHHRRVIVCDWDGPVARTFDLTLGLLRALHPEVTPESYRALFMGNIHTSTTLPSIKGSMGTFLERYANELDVGHIVDSLPYIACLVETHALHIITSNMIGGIVRVLECAGARDFFGSILGKEVSHSKVEKFHLLATQLGIAVSEIIFITDTLGDIKEAHEAGVGTVVAVTFGYHDRDTLAHGNPHALVDSWPEVIAAIGSK